VDGTVEIRFRPHTDPSGGVTTRRLVLMKLLHSTEKGLAGLAKRDYKNVYPDIKALEAVGLVLRGEKGFLAPWERIVGEILLAA